MSIKEQGYDYYIVDDMGGVHIDGIGFATDGTFCGECTCIDCKECPVKEG